MAKKKKATPTYSYAYPYSGQSERYKLLGPLASMTLEQLYEVEEALQFEFRLRESWRDLAAGQSRDWR